MGWKVMDLVVVFAVGALVGLLIAVAGRAEGLRKPGPETP